MVHTQDLTMKQHISHKNRDTEKDHLLNFGSASVSQHSFGFIHGFVFCLILKNIGKHVGKENASSCNSNFGKFIDAAGSLHPGGDPPYQSSEPCADVKEETTEVKAEEQEEGEGLDCSPSVMTATSFQHKLDKQSTEGENQFHSEKDSPAHSSFHVPLTDGNGTPDDVQSTNTYDQPEYFSIVKDDQPSTVVENSKLRKGKQTYTSKVKETRKRKQGRQSEEAQKITLKILQHSERTFKSESNITQKLQTTSVKKMKTSEKSTSGITRKHTVSSLDTKVKVGVTDTVFTCDKCDKTFTTARSCKRHTIKAHSSEETAGIKKDSEKIVHAQCDKCPKVYKGARAEKNLHQHMLACHSEVNPVQCDVCNATFNNEHHLKLHKRSSHRKDVCYICGAHFVTRVGLQTHMLAHKGDKAFICEICGAAFVRMSSLRQHTKFHTESRDFKCRRCPLSFKTFSTLGMHMMCVHQCGSYFNSQVQKLTKLGYVIDQTSLEHLQNCQCVNCGQELVDSACPLHSSDCMLSFSCPQCQWTTKDIQKFRTHLAKRNSATVCSGTEKTKAVKNCGGLTEKNRNLARNHVCPSCGKRFYTQCHLQAHRHQHAEKRFSCPLCQKSFTYKYNMQNHLTTHTDARPFECQICQKTFKMKSQFQLHQRYHNGEFKCDICGKILTRKHHVTKHYKLVHPESQLLK
ncbi:uncharacterized protein LOC143285865 [Babylonia areolata]|uniref:uncharacterized protein LOC143285865 n=1 Tax=Babylonia areolata TaxID=304850 RepID=UPI003FCF2235